MIPWREILALRSEWQLDANVIEKDYALGWLLAGIAHDDDLSETWVFKGGTCLRKCYFETYRLSEDLDFTVTDDGPETPEELTPIFTRIAEWMRRESGIEIVVEDGSFVRQRNRRGHPTTQGRLTYRGPNPPAQPPKVKIDITGDELLVEAPEIRPIVHPYSDAPLPVNGVRCYTLTELCGEKLRTLAERCRPRDLYDVVHMSRHPDLLDQPTAIAEVLARKCEFVGISVPDLASIQASPFREEIAREWGNMLGHQLPRPLPPFADFWGTLDDVFAWLAGEAHVMPLPRAELGQLDDTWIAPREMTSWRGGAPLELVRYAGANKMKVEIDYRAEEGLRGPRTVEPYSLRRTQDGNLLLFVVNDRNQLRVYRVDRIAAVRPTGDSFVPRFLVEF
ncbi:MAG: nucleotidyl transferase AbiEii/AbiGii toxin family protein [Dehalococcoidia bacterium]